MTTPPRYVAGWPAARWLLILALVFFVLAALLAGGVITASGLGWLPYAAAAAVVLAWLLP